VVAKIGQSSLEGTFLQLVEDRDVSQIAADIAEVIAAA